MAERKRKLDERDVSEAEECSSATVHGVVTQLSPQPSLLLCVPALSVALLPFRQPSPLLCAPATSAAVDVVCPLSPAQSLSLFCPELVAA